MDETPPQFVRRSASEFSIIFADLPVKQRKLSRDKRSLLHYAVDGTLVRMDCKDDTPRRETAYDPSELFTPITGAAKTLGVHPATLRRMAARGDLRALRIGNGWLTTAAWIDEYRRKRRSPGRPRKTA